MIVLLKCSGFKVLVQTDLLTQSGSQPLPTDLWEFVAHFFDLFPFLADDGSVKTLFNDQVLCTLVLLQETEYLVARQDAVCCVVCEPVATHHA